MAIDLLQVALKLFVEGDPSLMLGWMLIFALMIVSGTMSTLNGGIGSALGMTSSVVFGFLLVAFTFALLLRGRT